MKQKNSLKSQHSNKKIEYYNYNKLLSYGNSFNIVVGARGIGKSFRFKSKIIKNFIKHKLQFIMLVRYETDINTKIKNYFNDIMLVKYVDYEIKYKNEMFYFRHKDSIEWKIIGYVFPLSKSADNNSLSLPAVRIIFFDEFVTLKNNYIQNKQEPYKEIELLFNFYQTIARGNNLVINDDVKVFLISNAVTINNPYFNYFDLAKYVEIANNDINVFNIKDKNLTFEFSKINKIKNEILKSKFYKTIKGSDYSQFAIDNEFILDKFDNKFFIDTKNLKLKYICKIIYNKHNYLFCKTKNQFYFIEKNIELDNNLIYTILKNDTDKKYHNYELFKKSTIYQIIKNSFVKNKLFFDKMQTFNNFLLIFDLFK